MTVMGRGPADEAVVVVKLEADEDAVTYPRIKLTVSGRDAGGEGWNMLPSAEILLQIIAMRPAMRAFFERMRIFSVIAKDVQDR